MPTELEFQLGDRVCVTRDATPTCRLRTGVITRLGVGNYEITFEDNEEPYYAEIEARFLQKHDRRLRCPMCNGSAIQALTAGPYESNDRVTWHECLTCLRVWHSEKPLSSDSL
jgi:hypothetical protein